MWLAIQLAYRNLIGAGLRTWLNVIVLSFSFVIIIWMKGIMTGWDHQAKLDMIHYDIGGGQYWHALYDPYDPLSYADSHAEVPLPLKDELARGDLEPKLIIQGNIFPQGRMLPATLVGIRPAQNLFQLPTQKLDTITDAIPVFVGAMMAQAARLHIGDRFVVRWRDTHGTFDAAEVVVIDIFHSNVPNAEGGKVYFALETLYDMTLLHGHATLLTFRDPEIERTEVDGWVLKTRQELTRQVDDLIKTKSVGQSVLYVVLLLLAMLAIFDTQVLSIFRRQKEIGTYIALGYTRREVVGLFTVEGSMHAVLAAVLAAIYGLPFLMWQARVGWTMPIDTSQFGMAIAQTLYPVYSAGLVVMTILVVTLTTAVVSYIPSRKIAKMNPTEALRGKLQ